MARNQAGTYSLPAGSTVSNGETSDQSDLNIPLQDLETDANVARPVVAGGTGATTAAGARTNLGVQPLDDALTSIAGLATGANKLLYTTATDVFAETDISAYGRSLLDDADAAAARTTLELGTAATQNVLDEDDMSSDSATAPPSQQSTKAYVDNGALKAWACITYSGGTPTVAQSFNIASVTDNGVGDITITMTNALADTNYAVVATVAGTTSTGVRGVFEIAADRTTSAFRLEINTTSSASDLDTDPDILSVMVMR